MVGLAGVVDLSGRTAIEKSIHKMIGEMSYEDWYRRGTYIKEEFGIGWVCLGILGGEGQPVTEGPYTIILDGEIYNGADVAHRFGEEWVQEDPARLLLRLYQRNGSRFLGHLNGNFNFVIWNSQAKRLFVANDRYGLRPLYVTRCNGKFIICSKMHGIVADEDFRAVIDPAAVADFFTFEYVLGNKTFLEGVEVFPPGSMMTYENGHLRFDRYWEPLFEDDKKDRSIDDYVEEFASLVMQAVERRMNGGTVGVSLSGGFDSRTIAGAIGEEHRPFHTFTFGFPWSNDVRYARKIAKAVGAIHHFVPIDPNYLLEFAPKGVLYTDGMVNCIHFHIFNLLSCMRREVQIAHDGIVGNLYGITRDPRVLATEGDEEFVKGIYRKWNGAVKSTLQRHFFRSEFIKNPEELSFESLRSAIEEARASSRFGRWNYLSLSQRMRRFTQYGKVNMGTQVEVRTPFFDNDLMDFCLAMPDVLRRDKFLYAEMLRRKFPHLARIPKQDTELPIATTRLHEALKWRKDRLKYKVTKASKGLVNFHDRKPYADYPGWFRTNLRPFLSGLLLEGKPLLYEYLDEAFTRDLIESHMGVKSDYSVPIGCLITFELWLRGLESARGSSSAFTNIQTASRWKT